MDAAYCRQIEVLYLEMYEKLFIYSRCSLQNDALAEEAIQETFRIACTKPDTLCSSPNPQGWLMNTLKFVIVNTKRSRENARQLLDDYITSLGREMSSYKDELDPSIIYENIANLEEFHLIKELVLDGKSHLILAQERGITVDACKKRVQRAKKLLQEKIKL